MNKPRPKIFISSAITNLKSIREVLGYTFEKMGYDPVLSENWGVQLDSREPFKLSCIKKVRESDILLLIIGSRYGSVPKKLESEVVANYDSYESITEAEFYEAVRIGIPIFCLVEDEIYHEYKNFYTMNRLTLDRDNNLKSKAEFRVFGFLDKVYKADVPVRSFHDIKEVVQFSKEMISGLFERLLSESRKILDKDDILLEPVRHFNNIQGAIGMMDKRIAEIIKNRQTDIVTIELRHLSIAMKYSRNWISASLESLLDNPKVNVGIKLLLVDPKYLNSLKLKDTGKVNWYLECRQSIEELERYRVNFGSRFENLKYFEFKIYKNIPHWHGWLLNNEDLFLGRANWVLNEKERPELTVGQNRYRYFDGTTDIGQQRVQLFNSWFEYYFNFSSIKPY